MSRILKWALTVIIVGTFFNGLVFIALGVIKIYISMRDLLTVFDTQNAGIMAVESLDYFLIAMVFMIFSFGFAQLFYPSSKFFEKFTITALRVNSFKDLKRMLWTTLMLTLVIMFAANVVSHEGDFDWHFLVIPGCILLLSLASKFLMDHD